MKVQIDLCPKCKAVLNNVPEKLAVPNEPKETEDVKAEVWARAKCPREDCGYESELFKMGEWTGKRAELERIAS